MDHAKESREMDKWFVGKKNLLVTAALLGALGLSGCGDTSEEEKELAVFSSSVTAFKDYIQEADAKINGLDVSQKESVGELLEILDDMDQEFAEFAVLAEAQAPSRFESVPGLAQKASEQMTQAVAFYHTAYESEEFGKHYADAAYQYYTNSMEGIKYIGMLLLGEKIPESDNVTVYEITNDGHILDKWLSGGDEDDGETASE